MSIAILSKNKKEKKQKQPKETFQQTLLSCVFMFACVLIFHAIVFQPFQIPSGSMAPTLLGNHLRVTCSECGYTFKMDSALNPRYFRSTPKIICPMCAFPNDLKQGVKSSGDRIIVQKFAYEFSDPKRWDVVVFKTPKKTFQIRDATNDPNATAKITEYPGPINDFIKRCVGLPNENLRILDGNIYVQPVDATTKQPKGPFKIARKTENMKAQRAMFVPIYYSRYIPSDQEGGISSARVTNFTGTREAFYWHVPWTAEEKDASNWQLDRVREYTYKGQGESVLRFDFAKSKSFNPLSMYAYNQFRRPYVNKHPIEDLRLAVKVGLTNGAKGLELSTTGRWLDGLSKLAAKIGAKGDVTLTATSAATGEVMQIGKGNAGAIKDGAKFELWFVDQQLLLWRDGKVIAEAKYDLPLAELAKRDAAPLTPEIGIKVGGAMVLRDVELDRDLYYYTGAPISETARGAFTRASADSEAVENKAASPLALGDGEFFMIGDNSPWSHDSRYWDDVDAWVSANYLSGDQGRDRGIVPRELLVGKAMFVFYPSPLGWVPNFGDMRMID